jgi:hypothetical protein
MADTWRSVTSLPTDVKELIPEFYAGDPSFLLNTRGLDFGARTSGAKSLACNRRAPTQGQDMSACASCIH